MGEVRINLTNFLTIGLMAFAFTFVSRKVLAMTGVSKAAE